MLVKRDDASKKAVRTLLQRINDTLAAKSTRFLTGETLCCFDCELMPKLQHIRVAGKFFVGFEIPPEMTHLWNYIREMYKLDAFTQSCPADQVIIIFIAIILSLCSFEIFGLTGHYSYVQDATTIGILCKNEESWRIGSALLHNNGPYINKYAIFVWIKTLFQNMSVWRLYFFCWCCVNIFLLRSQEKYVFVPKKYWIFLWRLIKLYFLNL